jgi:hypothetical protein
MSIPKHLISIGSVLTLVAVTMLTGCSWSRDKEARESGRTPTQVTDDRHISDRITQSLKESPVYKFPEVGVRTSGRVVQLHGFVATEEQKRAAGEIAMQAPGALRVINDIVIQPQVMEPTGLTQQPGVVPGATPAITSTNQPGS